MGKRRNPYIGKTERSITDDGLENCSARLLPPYSVVLSSRAPIGHLAINTAPKPLPWPTAHSPDELSGKPGAVQYCDWGELGGGPCLLSRRIPPPMAHRA